MDRVITFFMKLFDTIHSLGTKYLIKKDTKFYPREENLLRTPEQ